MLSPYSYDQTDFAHMLEWPSRLHPFGTDKMGRDIFVRTMYGARISLTIGFYGRGHQHGDRRVLRRNRRISGRTHGHDHDAYCGRAQRNSQPSVLILIMMFLGNTVKSILLAMCLTFWITTARMVRGQILTPGAGFCAGSQGRAG